MRPGTRIRITSEESLASVNPQTKQLDESRSVAPGTVGTFVKAMPDGWSLLQFDHADGKVALVPAGPDMFEAIESVR